MGQPLAILQGVGVALVVGAILAMNRTKTAVRERFARDIEHAAALRQGGRP